MLHPRPEVVPGVPLTRPLRWGDRPQRKAPMRRLQDRVVCLTLSRAAVSRIAVTRAAAMLDAQPEVPANPPVPLLGALNLAPPAESPHEWAPKRPAQGMTRLHSSQT